MSAPERDFTPCNNGEQTLAHKSSIFCPSYCKPLSDVGQVRRVVLWCTSSRTSTLRSTDTHTCGYSGSGSARLGKIVGRGGQGAADVLDRGWWARRLDSACGCWLDRRVPRAPAWIQAQDQSKSGVEGVEGVESVEGQVLRSVSEGSALCGECRLSGLAVWVDCNSVLPPQSSIPCPCPYMYGVHSTFGGMYFFGPTSDLLLPAPKISATAGEPHQLMLCRRFRYR